MTEQRKDRAPDRPDLPPPPRLALVGDRSSEVQAHARIPLALGALARQAPGEAIEPYWFRSSAITGPQDVAGFDGVWVIPGSPYENRDGVLAAIEAARTASIPFLGTCGGFQHLLLELAWSACGLRGLEHGEDHPEAPELLIVPLRCSLLGEEATVTVLEGTLAAAAMGAGASAERFFCRYGLDERYLATLEQRGLVVSARDEAGEARVVELSGHPFFVGSLFQPELSSDATFVHPLIAAFADAVRRHAAGRAAAGGAAAGGATAGGATAGGATAGGATAGGARSATSSGAGVALRSALASAARP